MELITILIIVYLILAHWVADFVFQDEKWALAKKDNLSSLLAHTFVYSSIMGIMFFPIFFDERIFDFCSLLFISHTFIDYFSSKIVGRRFEKKYLGGPIPNFGAFTMIGLDQVLHYFTMLIILYFLL